MRVYAFIIKDENGIDRLVLQEQPVTWDEIRMTRDSLLLESDWVALADCSLSDGEKQNWFQYRQSLRDITIAFPTPQDVIWPEKP